MEIILISYFYYQICIIRIYDKTKDVLEYFNQTHEIPIQRCCKLLLQYSIEFNFRECFSKDGKILFNISAQAYGGPHSLIPALTNLVA